MEIAVPGGCYWLLVVGCWFVLLLAADGLKLEAC